MVNIVLFADFTLITLRTDTALNLNMNQLNCPNGLLVLANVVEISRL